MSDAPERIWTGIKGTPGEDDWHEYLPEGGGIEYVHADLYAALEAENHELCATPFADRVRENVAYREREAGLNNQIAALEAERDRLRAFILDNTGCYCGEPPEGPGPCDFCAALEGGGDG